MIKKILLTVFAITLISSCETTPPNSFEIVEEYGKVFVSSNIDSSEIFVDDSFTGLYSPDTLTLLAGSYKLTLKKDGYISKSEEIVIESAKVKSISISLVEFVLQQVVLIEDFSNVSCGPCVASNQILKSLKKTYDKSKLLILKYATNFPSPNDPMHLASSGDAKTRMSFYNILFTPTIYVNGVDKPIASDSNSIKEKIDSNLLKSAKLKIDSDYSLKNDSIKVNVTVKVLDDSDLNFSKLNVFVAIQESKIEYATPPGSNGETEFEDVLRKLLPGHNGYSISSLKDNNEIQFNWGTKIESIWNRDRIEVIAFIQDANTGVIYQASSSVLN